VKLVFGVVQSLAKVAIDSASAGDEIEKRGCLAKSKNFSKMPFECEVAFLLFTNCAVEIPREFLLVDEAKDDENKGMEIRAIRATKAAVRLNDFRLLR
jgi:hypothetical protein